MNETWTLQCSTLNFSDWNIHSSFPCLSSHRDAEILLSRFASYIINRHAGSEQLSGGEEVGLKLTFTPECRFDRFKGEEGGGGRGKTGRDMCLNLSFIFFMYSTLMHVHTYTHMLLVNNAAGAQCAIHTDHCRLLTYTALVQHWSLQR